LICLFCSDQAKGQVGDAMGSGVVGDQAEERNPILRALAASNPNTLLDLARAVQITMDLEREDQTKVYIDQLLKIEATDLDWFELQRKYSTSFLLDLNSRESLAAESGQLFEKMRNAVDRVNSAPDRLDSLVKQLSLTDRVARSQAFFDLKGLGEPGAAALINVLADESRTDEHQTVLDALGQFGLGSVPPLMAGLSGPSERVQMVSAFLLGNFKTTRSVEMLLGAVLANKTGQTRTRALESIELLLGEVPDEKTFEATVFKSANNFLNNRVELVEDYEGKVFVWRWQDSKLVGLKLAPLAATRKMALDRAANLYAHDPSNEKYRRLYFLCLLDSAKSISGISLPLDLKPFLDSPLRDPKLVEVVLADALDANRIPAAIAATELLSKVGDASLLSGSQGRLSVLLRALTFGDRRLQFAATMTVLQLAPKSPFPGSTHVVRSLVHMVSAAGYSKTVVGHIERTEAQNMVAALRTVRMNGQVATTSRELFDTATLDADVEFILISESMHSPGFAELVQQLRSDWRLRTVPIGVLYRDESKRAKRFADSDPLTIAIPWTTNSELLARQVSRLTSLNSVDRVATIERAIHADQAAEWLVKLAEDKKMASVFELAPFERQLVTALFVPGVSKSISQVLAGFGSRRAQLALLRLADDGSQMLEDRIAAVKAFDSAINRAGILLTKNEIELQYTRFNAAEFENAESQKILASILDSIEQRVKSTRNRLSK